MATCKGCGARITWVQTPAGKQMPCDEKMVTFQKKAGAPGKFVTKGGNIVSGELVDDLSLTATAYVGYIPHWSTCPAAQRFKRK